MIKTFHTDFLYHTKNLVNFGILSILVLYINTSQFCRWGSINKNAMQINHGCVVEKSPECHPSWPLFQSLLNCWKQAYSNHYKTERGLLLFVIVPKQTRISPQLLFSFIDGLLPIDFTNTTANQQKCHEMHRYNIINCIVSWNLFPPFCTLTFRSIVGY